MPDPYIPPSQADLEASTEQAFANFAKLGDLGLKDYEIDGNVSILAVQFPDIPAVTLGRILISASVCAATVVRARLLAAAAGTAPALDAAGVACLLAATAVRLAGQEEVPRG